MCFSLIWKDLFKSIKTFRLKSQLLLCYISIIFMVMIFLLLTIYILLNNLENSTVYEIEDTLNTINRHNSLDFTKEYASSIENLLNSTAITSSYINFYMQNLQVSNPFRRPYITTYEDLPRECTVRLPQYENYVCMNYSSVTYLSKSHPQTDELGYLAYILPEIFTLLSPFVHRIIIFVSGENSTIVFPGQRLPRGYNASESSWFQSLINTQVAFVFNPSYNDSLNQQNVVSLSQMIEIGSSLIALNIEIQENILYSLFSTNAYILESEEKVLTTKSGQILYNKNSSLFNSKGIKTMHEFSPDIWKNAMSSKVSENVFFLHDHQVFYRVTIQKIPAGSKEPWLYLFLFLKEKTLMKYKDETQDTLNSFSYLLLGLTCIIGVIIILVSAIIVNLTGSSVSKPLIGIKTLTDRINVGEVKIEEELEKLEEGTEQVAELVRAFKSLATTISSRRHTDVQFKGKKEILPPNELYQTGRVTWKDDDRLVHRNSRIVQAFPGFRVKTFTFFITLVQIVVYFCSVLLGNYEMINPSAESLITLGAMFWRLFTALLLHGNFMHLMVSVRQINVFSQMRLCFAMEKFYKLGRFFIIYLLAGLGGNLLSGIMYPEHVLVGSSASLFGIFGCYGCYFVYNWHSIGPGRNLNLLIYLFFIVISLELPITLTSIEIIGHLGGYVVGFSLGFFLMPKDERSEAWDMIRIINGIAVLVYFATMIWNFSNINVKVHGPGFYLNLAEKNIFISLSPGEKVETIYKSLQEFHNVRVESLEGVKIGQTTYFSELQGSSFYVKVGQLTFKIIQSDLETPLGMHKFLFENEAEGVEKFIFMHQYLNRLNKAAVPGRRFTKEALANLIQDSCPSLTSHALSAQEIHDRILRVFSEIKEMRESFEKIDKSAAKHARRVLWSGFLVTVAQFAYITSGTYYFYCWDIMEAQAYLITLGNTVFGLAMYTYYKLQPHQMSFYSRVYDRALSKKSKSCNFDVEKYQKLRKELENLQAMLTLDSSLNKPKA